MKNKDMIKALQKLPPDGTVWISDEQGRYVEANRPHEVDEERETDNGETLQEGDTVISFENT